MQLYAYLGVKTLIVEKFLQYQKLWKVIWKTN